MRSRSRLAFYVIMLAAVFLIARASAAPADEPPSPDPAPVEVDRMVQGKNVDQWHRVAARYLRGSRLLAHSVAPPRTHWLERAFMCIHGFEGRWTDPNAPYYGGLQMDGGFQRSYGGWAVRAFGTADHWPVSVQIAVAIRAYYSGRRFYPWPNTARYCGLI